MRLGQITLSVTPHYPTFKLTHQGGREVRNSHEPVLREDQSKAVSSRQDRTDDFMISKQPWSLIQDQASQYSIMEEGRVHENPPQTGELPMDR